MCSASATRPRLRHAQGMIQFFHSFMAMKSRQETISQEPVRPAWQRAGMLYLLGIDGLSPDVIRQMREAGELPNMRSLASDGASGALATIWPTFSPIIWTSIATGRHVRDHGIDGFQWARILGARVGHNFVRIAKKIGFKYALLAMERHGLMRRFLYTNPDIKSWSVWEIFSRAGLRAGAVNWWNTWPAYPLNGFIVSDRVHHWRASARGVDRPPSHLTHPQEFLEQLRGAMVAPDQVTADDLAQYVNAPESELRDLMAAPYSHHQIAGELRFLISADRTQCRVFDEALDRFAPLNLAALYVRGVDIAQHCAFHFMASAAHSDASEADRRKYGNVVPQAYRAADEIIGRVRKRMGPDDSMIVLSDHGFGWQDGRSKYSHARGMPPGVIYCIGPEFAPGASIAGASVFDAAPTILRVCGFPVAQDMPGRSLETALTEKFRSAHPEPPRIRTYGPRRLDPLCADSSDSVDKDVAEHLKALGYID